MFWGFFSGATPTQWLGFHLLLAVLLAADIFFSGRQPSFRRTLLLTFGWLDAALLFAVWLRHSMGHAPALEFLSGYSVEQTLSLDNLFIFLLLFRSFAVPPAAQRRVLFWGVLGAIVMRGAFIFGGIALINRFHWIQFVFAAALLIAAIRMLTHSESATPRWLSPLLHRAQSTATPLLIVLLAVEFSDILFALDSVPAVLAITHRPFIAYTSNLFAVMGLRSLYFVLAGALSRLRHLHFGLAALLAFIAAKMLLADWLPISTSVSLAIILSVLGITIATSLLLPQILETTE